MTAWTSNFSTSDITGRNSHLIYTTKVDRQVLYSIFSFADIQLSFTSNQNVLQVPFHFIKSFENINIAPKIHNIYDKFYCPTAAF